MATTTPTTRRTFAIDKAHSEVLFQVRHLVTRVRGRFSDFEGAIEYDEADPTRSSVDVVIRAASVDTNEPTRDTHLKSADFFSVEEFPTLTFKSTSIARIGEDKFDVTGDLSIRGVTRQVVLKAGFLGKAKDPWGNERIGFDGEVTVNRKEYGLMWNAALETGGFLVGDEVKITVSVQAVGK